MHPDFIAIKISVLLMHRGYNFAVIWAKLENLIFKVGSRKTGYTRYFEDSGTFNYQLLIKFLILIALL